MASVCAGKVVFQGYDPLKGRVIKIHCNSGYEFLYGHLSDWNDVHIDQIVKKGDVIGKSGGRQEPGVEQMSTAAHAHMELWKDKVQLKFTDYVYGGEPATAAAKPVTQAEPAKPKLIASVANDKSGCFYSSECGLQCLTTKGEACKGAEPVAKKSGSWHISSYYSPVSDQAKYYNGSYAKDKSMNCGPGSCLDTADGTKLDNSMANKVVACGRGYKYGTKFKITMPSDHPVHPGGSIIVTCHDRGGAIDNKQLDLWVGTGTSGGGYPWIGEWSTRKGIVEVIK